MSRRGESLCGFWFGDGPDAVHCSGVDGHSGNHFVQNHHPRRRDYIWFIAYWVIWQRVRRLWSSA